MSLHILEWLKLKANNRKCEWKCGIIEAFILCWWEYKTGQSVWKTVWHFHKKLNIYLPHEHYFHFRYLFNGNENKWYQKDLYTNLPNSFIYNNYTKGTLISSVKWILSGIFGMEMVYFHSAMEAVMDICNNMYEYQK